MTGPAFTASRRRWVYAGVLAVTAALAWLVTAPGPAGGAFPGENGKTVKITVPGRKRPATATR